MSNYLGYSGDSTNVVKSKQKLAKILQITSYLLIWTMVLLLFWLFTSGSDAMGYSLLVFYCILPMATFIDSIIIGCDSGWRKTKWLMSLFFGFMYMLAEYTTFRLANMIANANSPYVNFEFRAPELSMLLIGSVISLMGMGIGVLIKLMVARKRRG